MTFELHTRLKANCAVIGDLPLCRLLLMDDANYPWCILVPRRNGIREIYELSEPDQQQLLRESSTLARVMMEVFAAEKMNIAALGNVVPQLHVHHIARYARDAAWPKPVWDVVPKVAYTQEALEERITRLKAGMTGSGFPL